VKRGVERGEGRKCCVTCVGHEGRRCGRGERQSGAILSHHRMASVGGWGRAVECCGGLSHADKGGDRD